MNKYLVILSALLVTGCRLEGYQVEAAQDICKDKGGISSLHFDAGHANVRCMDGGMYKDVGRKKK